MTLKSTLSPGAQMVANRLRKNLKRLRNWRRRNAVTCYRAYDADLPEYAAAVDVYQEASGEERVFLHVQEYQAPASIPEATAEHRLGELVAAVSDVFEIDDSRLALKTRARGKGGSKYGRMAERGEHLLVQGGQVKLWVNLFDYLDTGLFLDHRPLRLRIAPESAGRRMLNLFCYTGAASVHAAAGKAASTTSVDLSATYLGWAARNMAQNGFDQAVHERVQADVMTWLSADRGSYDLIFCDPPTFSNSKRAEDFDIQREHVRLLTLSMDRLAPGGRLLFSNNFRRFQLDEPAINEIADWREISPQTIDPDFERNSRIHRCWELEHRPT